MCESTHCPNASSSVPGAGHSGERGLHVPDGALPLLGRVHAGPERLVQLVDLRLEPRDARLVLPPLAVERVQPGQLSLLRVAPLRQLLDDLQPVSKVRFPMNGPRANSEGTD